MTHRTTGHEHLRHRLRRRLAHFRDRSVDRHRRQSSEGTVAWIEIDPASILPGGTSADFLHSIRANDTDRESAGIENNQVQVGSHHSSSLGVHPEQSLAVYQTDNADDNAILVASSDLWSAAYREAVESLGEEIDIAILKGKNLARLFEELEEIEKEVTHESAFLRGVKYLRSLQVPLERFKLALDLATPLASLEPTANTVVGITRGVTAIAISITTADQDFAKQIAEMLEQIAYIDDCDTLGQKAERKDIHKALVSVYQKILEFYKVAFEILTRKGARLMLKMVLETDRLPNIVKDFLSHSNFLRKLVQKATWEIVEDIKAMLYDREITRWLGGDKMSRQSQFHSYLQSLRADQACDFLLQEGSFTDWYQASSSRQLAILGDTGSGKTVAMTFLVDELSRRNEFLLPQPKICYYYCTDDETGKAIYAISALILSLLEQLPGLKKKFFEWYKQAQACGIFNPATNMRVLENFLEKLMAAIDRPVFILIDGLDECDAISRRNLINLLKTLSQTSPRLKTVLACRPEEQILEQLGEMARIELSPDPQRDAIIVEKSVERQLHYLSTDVKALVIDTLSKLARGSAIWTKMIIELIEIRKIRALNPMRRFLEEIPLPQELSQLYAALVSRCTSNDPENEYLACTALRLLAVSHRPFSILELSWAVTLNAARGVTTVDALSKLIDHQRIIGLICPFIARVDFSNVRKRQVRLAHQSVKEFIIREWGTHQPVSENPFVTDTNRKAVVQSSQSLEGEILAVCVKYLLLDNIGDTNLFSDEQVAIAELPQEADLFSDNHEPVEYDRYCSWETWEEDMIRYDPTERGFGEFFIYASCHWLEHFGAITAAPLPDLEAIQDLCHANSTRLHNWIQQNCRPDCAIPPRFEFNSSLYDPLSITALYGSESMLRHMLARSSFGKDRFLDNTVMRAADQIIQWGDFSRLRILFLDDRLGHHLQNLDFFRLAIQRWFHPVTKGHDWGLVFDLISCMSAKLTEEQWGNELLCVAAAAGCLPIIRRLMASAQHDKGLRDELLRGVRTEQQSYKFGKPTHQSIGEAVMGNHLDVVEFLLRENNARPHLRYRNSHGESVLHLASRLCNPDMFRLLVPHFSDGAFQTDDQGATALVRIIMSYAASQNRYQSARVLLEHSGAGWNGHTSHGQQNPLRAAVQLGDLDMCQLLVGIGKIDPLSALTWDSEGQMDLKDRGPENQAVAEQILQLLCPHPSVAAMSNVRSDR